jgi:NADH:ubiquinone oxidoreductase subunit 6 (subunit J)
MTEHSDQQQPFRGVGGEGIPSTGASDEEELAAAKLANRFDIRRIIGGVFVLYAIVLIVTGAIGSDEVKNKAAGINVNLWTGLGMLVVGILMIFWALSRPVAPEPSATRGRGSGDIRRSSAT